MLLAAAAAVLATGRGRGGKGGTFPAPPRAVAAQRFADSVGVNVHLSYGDTAYGDAAQVERALVDLGVRHVRDGACAGCTWTFPRISALARRGIRFTLVAGDPSDRTGTLDENLAVIRGPLRHAVEAVEGPNEYDASGDPAWAGAVREYQRSLFTRVRADPALRSLAVIGPSFVRPEGRARAGDLSAWMTEGNMHPYPAGAAPARTLAAERPRAATVARTRPLVATETGYHNALHASTGQPSVDEATAAAYVPSLFLEAFRQGIRRTFLYELADEKPDPAGRDPEQHFGLVRTDFSRKPAFTALAGLLRAIGTGVPRHGPERLDYRLVGADRSIRRLLFQRGDRSFALALWREVASSEPEGRTDVAPARLTLRLGGAPARVRVLVRGAVVERAQRPGKVPITLGRDPAVVQIDPAGAP